MSWKHTLVLASVSEGASPFSDSSQRRGALTNPGWPGVSIAEGVGQGLSVGDAGSDAATSLRGEGGHDALENKRGKGSYNVVTVTQNLTYS